MMILERGWPLGDPSEIDSRKKPLDDKVCIHVVLIAEVRVLTVSAIEYCRDS